MPQAPVFPARGSAAHMIPICASESILKEPADLILDMAGPAGITQVGTILVNCSLPLQSGG